MRERVGERTLDVVAVTEGVADDDAVTVGVRVCDEYSEGDAVTVPVREDVADMEGDGDVLGVAQGGKYFGSACRQMMDGSGQMTLPV
jgi:hypothetical protein